MADLLVCSGAVKLVVGEVKGPRDNVDVFFQCVAGMQEEDQHVPPW